MRETRLTVIIINWNTKALLERCLNALYANIPKGLLYEVIAVDNGSVDGSSQMLKEKFPKVKVISNEDNTGFAAANNKALNIAGGKYVLFLNTDVILTEGAIGKLSEFMNSRPNTALCTPSLIREDGSQQETYISFPALKTELFGRLILKEKKEPCRVQSIRGACMLARKDILSCLGGFNERYFFFLEETDLCLRLYKKGYEVWYIPNVSVIHTGGGSAEKDKIGARIEYWRSRYIFFRENYSLWNYVLLNLGLSIKLLFDWMINLIVFSRKSKVYLNIILWHLLGKPGDWGIDSENIYKLDNWLVRNEFKSWWGENKNTILKGENCKLLKENSSRKMLLYDNGVFIKIYKKKSIFGKPWTNPAPAPRLCVNPAPAHRSWVQGRGWVKEWRLINRLRQLDIDTVMPIACGSGYLITKRLDNVKTLHEFILKDKIGFSDKLDLTMALADFIKKLHKKGVCHGDLHAGNILIERRDNGYKFYITDLHRAKIKIFLTKKKIIDNLVQLDRFFSIEVSPSARLRFLRYYVSGTKMEKDYKDYARKIQEKTMSSCHKLWQKRDGLYLVKDKYGIKGKCEGVKYILNPEYKNIDIASVIKRVKTGYGDVIKDSRSSYLSRFNISGIGNVVLKIYKHKKFINYLKDYFRKSRGFRAWRGSWALITRVIQTPLPILAGEVRKYGILKNSFIITKDIPEAMNLTLFVKNIPEPVKQEVACKLSSYIKRIHERGIFPLDMKGSNILVQREDNSAPIPILSGRRGEFNFYLIDLDHIKIKKSVTLSDRFYNIKQIKKSTGLSCHVSLPIKRILIVKPSSLGDIIQALPTAALLRNNFPSANIWWLANRRYIDLIKLAPCIDRTIAFERDRWSKWKNIFNTVFEFAGFIRYIRSLRFDIVLDLQGLFRSGLITGFSKAPLRIGFGDARECAGLFYNNRMYQGLNRLNAKEKYLAITEYVSTSQNVDNKLNIPDGLKKWAGDLWGDDKDIRIVVNPGGRWLTKRWLSTRYAELIDVLNKKYDAKVLLIGDENDSAVTNSVINEMHSSAIDLAGKISLTELSAILSGCCVLITNDSGPLHLADYLGKPVVAIFGPTDPCRTGPTGEKNKIIKSEVSCSPCFRRYCKNIKCLEDISVEEVLDAVEDVLQK